jgi:hypothetical protein
MATVQPKADHQAQAIRGGMVSVFRMILAVALGAVFLSLPRIAAEVGTQWTLGVVLGVVALGWLGWRGCR